jgi:iron complex transport system permease protein
VAISVALLLAIALLGVMIGGTEIPAGAVVSALLGGPQVERGDVIATIIWRLRLPRVALAALVGAALAMAGVGYQAAFRNPLADPYLLGSASGAGFAAAVTIALGLPAALLAPAAFVGAAGAVALAIAFAARAGSLPVVALLLAGVVIGSSLAAGTSLVLLAAREQAAAILTWLLGSFAFASWGRFTATLPWVAAAGVVLALLARPLDVLQAGERSAALLGVRVEGVKIAVVIAATLATAAAVSVAGVIGFLGLLVPHAVRASVGPRHRYLLPVAALWGAGFLVLADLLARTLLAPVEIPVGVVTALCGAPLFLALLRRGERT